MLRSFLFVHRKLTLWENAGFWLCYAAKRHFKNGDKRTRTWCMLILGTEIPQLLFILYRKAKRRRGEPPLWPDGSGKKKEGERMAEGKKLSAKVERFCEEYIVDYKAEKAAVRAGYKAESARTTAWRLLKNEEVAARVRELQEEYNKANCFAEKSRCIKEIWKTYEKAQGEEDLKTAVKCLELIGKTNGMFSDTTNLKFGNSDIEINIKVDDEE